MITFFLDRTFGALRVASVLRASGWNIEVHQDHFRQDIPDQEWIPVVAMRRWVVLTQDKNIRNRPLEREAVRRSGLRLFAFTQNNLPSSETSAILLRALPQVVERATEQVPPFIGQIQRTGAVRIIEDFAK
jgi:predicted nuclease of predicted toxin-antitoxin system